MICDSDVSPSSSQGRTGSHGGTRAGIVMRTPGLRASQMVGTALQRPQQRPVSSHLESCTAVLRRPAPLRKPERGPGQTPAISIAIGLRNPGARQYSSVSPSGSSWATAFILGRIPGIAGVCTCFSSSNTDLREPDPLATSRVDPRSRIS